MAEPETNPSTDEVSTDEAVYQPDAEPKIADLVYTGQETVPQKPSWIELNPQIAEAAGLFGLFLLSVLVFIITRRVVMPLIHKVVAKSKTTWDDVLIEAHVVKWVCWVAVSETVHHAVAYIPFTNLWLWHLIASVASATTVLFVALAISALMSAINAIYSRREISKSKPIKGYIQLAKIFLFIVTGILMFAIINGQDPGSVAVGLGAMTAVILLIFKDTILSLVASIQVTSYDMVRVGDWVEMPKYGADGDVVDISLHTIKIQNWDKTISTVPTSKFIEDSFKNWRGMSESGGRRIKRSVTLDLNTVRFLTDEEIERFAKFSILKDYIEEKTKDLDTWNKEHNPEGEIAINGRQLTNLGTLRAYIQGYIKANPHIHQKGMTCLIRQLAPSDKGVPIEMYMFTTTTAWAEYEAIQGDIFDHILAVVPEFGLRVFQSPAGSDFARLVEA